MASAPHRQTNSTPEQLSQDTFSGQGPLKPDQPRQRYSAPARTFAAASGNSAHCSSARRAACQSLSTHKLSSPASSSFFFSNSLPFTHTLQASTHPHAPPNPTHCCPVCFSSRQLRLGHHLLLNPNLPHLTLRLTACCNVKTVSRRLSLHSIFLLPLVVLPAGVSFLAALINRGRPSLAFSSNIHNTLPQFQTISNHG